MAKSSFDGRQFWQNRLAADSSLKGTGHRAFDLRYNQWFYAAQKDSLDLLIRRNSLSVAGKNILDIGSGNGFFVDYFQEKGAQSVSGLDISEASVNLLQKKFPSLRFANADISLSNPFAESFDIISAISVLFHIVDDERFAAAIHNMAQSCSPGGAIILSDALARPIIPTARHVRLRTIQQYQAVFEQNHLKILDVVPMFYLLNQTFIPFLGPRIINWLRLGEWFYRVDRRWRDAGRNNLDGAKLLLAQRTAG